MLATVSHEIRTPMNGVIGLIDLLLQTELDSSQRQIMETLKESSDALVRVTSMILDHVRADAGKLELESVEFDLLSEIEGVVRLTSGVTYESDIDVSFTLPTSVAGRYQGDAGRLRQMLLNLLNNAAKFTSEGEIGLQVTASDPDRQDGSVMLRFEVLDTGVGIDEDIAPMLFEKFHQRDASVSRLYGGSGLGLAIVSDLAALMGGACGVRHRSEGGSVFWFEVRMQRIEKTIRARSATAPAIRIVDSRPLHREATAAHLDRFGYSIADAAEQDEIVLVNVCGPDGGTSLPGGTRSIMMLPKPIYAAKHAEFEAQGSICIEKPVLSATLRSAIEQVAAGPMLTVVHSTAPTEAPTGPTETPESGGAPRLLAPRLLIVDDNKINRTLANAILSSAGYDCAEVDSGAGAVTAMVEEAFDLVLMDLQMPGMDGLEATRRIRALDGAASNVPIIALTGDSRDEAKPRCFEAGMNGYLMKPINRVQLLDTLAEWVKPAEKNPAATPAGSGPRSAPVQAPSPMEVSAPPPRPDQDAALAGFLDDLAAES